MTLAVGAGSPSIIKALPGILFPRPITKLAGRMKVAA